MSDEIKITKLVVSGTGSNTEEYDKYSIKAHWVITRGGMILKGLQGNQVGKSGPGTIDVVFTGKEKTEEQKLAIELVDKEMRSHFPDIKSAGGQSPPPTEGKQDG